LEGPPDAKNLHDALRLLAKWRAQLLENTMVAHTGRFVHSGPFKGMIYDVKATEGAGLARLLGCYEASLAPIFEDIIARTYPVVMDIGCAEGYYAVGLARRMPDVKVMAHDTNPKAQEACRLLAKSNAVDNRVQVGGTVNHAAFDICIDQKTLVLCDIEGGEAALLDPIAAPGLKLADILVEVHDCFDEGLSDRISERFADTHRIERFGRTVNMEVLPDWMEGLSDLDRILSLWEWRMGPTPWLWLKSND
jgi:hypothetical protein